MNFKTVLELFADPKRWTKSSMGRDLHGQMCASGDPDAVCWCLAGAIFKVYGTHSSKGDSAFCRVAAVLKQNGIGRTEILNWNDRPERTHDEVLKVCEEAMI